MYAFKDQDSNNKMMIPSKAMSLKRRMENDALLNDYMEKQPNKHTTNDNLGNFLPSPFDVYSGCLSSSGMYDDNNFKRINKITNTCNNGGKGRKEWNDETKQAIEMIDRISSNLFKAALLERQIDEKRNWLKSLGYTLYEKGDDDTECSQMSTTSSSNFIISPPQNKTTK
jgi:hypothetical protein